MTIKQLAKEVGVATSTVSRIISGKDPKCASEEVKARVWKAVRESGYVPNHTAQSLRTGEAKTTENGKIFCLLARSSSPNDSYFFGLATEVEREAVSHGYSAARRIYYNEVSTLDVKELKITKCDGLMVLGRPLVDLSRLIKAFSSRVVYISLNPVSVDSDQVYCNGYDAAKIALNYLAKSGHKRIAYVGECLNEMRYVSYKDFCSENDSAFSRELVFPSRMHEDDGRAAADAISKLSPLPDAVFCASDLTAIGLLSRLSELNVSVPDDLSVISIDNIPAAINIKPSLTTICLPFSELAYIAVVSLLGRISGSHRSNIKVFVPPELIVRESVKTKKPS